jgi:acyl-CoA thioester hydrolase
MGGNNMVQTTALEGYPVVVRLPIQWGDLDAYGHVNNVVYLKWFEAARAVYASRVGVEILARDRGIGAVLASITCKYRHPLVYPADVLAGVRVTRMSIGSVTLQCCIAEARTGVPVADAACDVVLYDFGSDMPVPVPDRIRAAVESLEGRSFD